MSSLRKWIGGTGAIVLIASAVIALAQSAAPNAPADASGNSLSDTSAADAAARTRVPADYAQLNLDDATKAKILAIREKAAADERAIRAKETSDLRALLSPAQLTQLDLIDQKAADAVRSRRTEGRLQQRILTDQEKLDAVKNPAPPAATSPAGN